MELFLLFCVVFGVQLAPFLMGAYFVRKSYQKTLKLVKQGVNLYPESDELQEKINQLGINPEELSPREKQAEIFHK